MGKSGVLAYSELFQVIAKASGVPPPPMEVFRQMLQTLLADRFQLRIHHVQKDLPTYNLVVKKGGPKLQESAADAKFNFQVSSPGRLGVRIVATHMTMQELIDHQLGVYTDRPSALARSDPPLLSKNDPSGRYSLLRVATSRAKDRSEEARGENTGGFQLLLVSRFPLLLGRPLCNSKHYEAPAG